MRRSTVGLRRPGLRAMWSVAMVGIILVAGCARTGTRDELDEVSKSVGAADPTLTGIDVEQSMDGFGRVLSLEVAIREPAIDSQRLLRLLSAVANSEDAQRFDDLHLSVKSPDLDGTLLDLEAPAERLGFHPPSKPVLILMENLTIVKNKTHQYRVSRTTNF